MTGWNPSPTPALERPETRRDPRAGSDATATLLQTDAFARMLDATLDRGAAGERAPDSRDVEADNSRDFGRHEASNRRDAAALDSARRGEAARTEPGVRNAAAKTAVAEDAADAADEADAADAAAEDDAAADDDAAAEDTGDGTTDPGAPDDDLAALLKLMRPVAMKAFQAAVTGGEANGVNGVARLPAGMRPLTMGAQAASAAPLPEPSVPPARIAGQVMQALGRAEGLQDGRVRLTLDPAHLGKVDVTVSREAGRLEVTFRVESAEAEHALRSRSGELGQALLGKAAGWTDVRVTVLREGAEDEDATHDNQDHTPQHDGDESRDRDDMPDGQEGES